MDRVFPKTHEPGAFSDIVWEKICGEAEDVVRQEPLLASMMHSTILAHRRLEDALSFHLASKLETRQLSGMLMREIIGDAVASDEIGAAVRADLVAFKERDPASAGFLAPLMYYKGFHALQSYRVASWLWQSGRKQLAYCFQNRISEAFGADIHPAARIGSGVLVDHGTGIVIGETAVIGDNVSLLQEVTLGGTGREQGDRHPKVRSGVLIGAGAKVLGNIEIGANAKIGAGSVVLTHVPPGVTVAGVPARIVGRCASATPALEMDHGLPIDLTSSREPDQRG
jgi:serine O-acetyltransferase